MMPFETWLVERGNPVATAINEQYDPICERVTLRMATAFPNLCFDPLRMDATSFQKQVFRETPRRLHRLIQVVLLCQSMAVVEREYRWGWRILSRFNVERRHMIAHARWYFDEVFVSVPLINEDKLQLTELRDHVIRMIDSTTVTTQQFADQARRRQTINGNGINHSK
jgi:hypothetical protein